MVTGVDLSVDVGGIRLKNPVLAASGTFGYGLELEPFVDPARLGGFVTKGLTLAPRAGNAPRRIAEAPAGMINSIGLQNVGLEAFLLEKLPLLARLETAVIVNVSGNTIAEYAELAGRLDAAGSAIAAIELNVSCPNVVRGGREFGTDPGVLFELVAAARSHTRLPLWVKLSPSVTDIAELAAAAEGAGADAIVAVNTASAAYVEPVWEGSRLSARILRGGLSGPGLKPIALRAVADIRRTVRLPIVGVGGIASVSDVLEFLAIGASAVQVGTASFADPQLLERLPGQLAIALAERGSSSLEEALGRALDGPTRDRDPGAARHPSGGKLTPSGPLKGGER